MYLQEYIGDKDTVLTDAMKHPAMSPKRKPTIDTAMKCVVSTLEFNVAQNIREVYEPQITELYEFYCLENGEFDTIPEAERDDWGSGIDDKVEALFEPLQATLSADWLARYTIDTHLEVEGGCAKLAEALGKEVFKQLAYGKEPGQVLSNAGIMRTDVEIYFEQHMKPKSQEEQTAMADETLDGLSDVIRTIRAHIGTDYDELDVRSDLENICDDDEILQGAGASRLGLSEGDLQVVQLYVLDVGENEAVDAMFSMIKADAPAVSVPPPPPPPGAPVPTPMAPAVPAAPKAQTATGFDAKYVLTMLKEHSAVKETELATEIGVSRSTFVNYGNGKTAFAPTDEQLQTLRNRVLEDLNGLYGALCNIDGVHIDRVFE